MHLGTENDFDEGVRVLKRGIRAAAHADSVTQAIQDGALASHDGASRRNTTAFGALL